MTLLSAQSASHFHRSWFIPENSFTNKSLFGQWAAEQRQLSNPANTRSGTGESQPRDVDLPYTVMAIVKRLAANPAEFHLYTGF